MGHIGTNLAISRPERPGTGQSQGFLAQKGARIALHPSERSQSRPHWAQFGYFGPTKARVWPVPGLFGSGRGRESPAPLRKEPKGAPLGPIWLFLSQQGLGSARPRAFRLINAPG